MSITVCTAQVTEEDVEVVSWGEVKTQNNLDEALGPFTYRWPAWKLNQEQKNHIEVDTAWRVEGEKVTLTLSSKGEGTESSISLTFPSAEHLVETLRNIAQAVSVHSVHGIGIPYQAERFEVVE